MKKIPSSGAIREALNYPNGWVYEIDPAFTKEEETPPQAILGAWEVNENGVIVGDFIPNPNYLDLTKMNK